MCIHETVQMTDEHRTILCADCGREFGHIGRDAKETFFAYVTPDNPVVLLADEGAPVGIHVYFENDVLKTEIVYPCRECGWSASCDGEDGGCHT